MNEENEDILEDDEILNSDEEEFDEEELSEEEECDEEELSEEEECDEEEESDDEGDDPGNFLAVGLVADDPDLSIAREIRRVFCGDAGGDVRPGMGFVLERLKDLITCEIGKEGDLFRLPEGKTGILLHLSGAVNSDRFGTEMFPVSDIMDGLRKYEGVFPEKDRHLTVVTGKEYY